MQAVEGRCKVKVCWPHLYLSRLFHRFRAKYPQTSMSEKKLLEWFGRWSSKRLVGTPWDLVYSWSSVSLEMLQSPIRISGIRAVVRGSTHIAYQDRLLGEEGKRSGTAIERPEQNTILREVKEYSLADAIVVLSEFCRDSFIAEGISADKIICMPAGVDIGQFYEKETSRLGRLERLASSSEPLRVLMAGTFSLRKGAWDIAHAIPGLEHNRFQLRFVGSVHEDAKQLFESTRNQISFVGRVAQSELMHHFDWADVFLFPSLEEGLPQTLFQAAASGLPVLATPNSAVSDVLAGGGVGWSIPVCNPNAVASLLTQLESDRRAIIEKIQQRKPQQTRSWEMAVQSLESQVSKRLACA